MEENRPLNEHLEQLKARFQELRERQEHVPHELMQMLQQAVSELSSAAVRLRAARHQLHQRSHELADAYQLAESERRRYHELFTFAPDAYLVTDPAGVIQEANVAAEQLLGHDADQLRGERFNSYVIEDDRGLFTDCLAHAMSTGGVHDQELTLTPASGDPFPAALRVATVHDEAGGVTALRWLVRDITERRRAERQIAEYQTHLRALASDLTLTEQRERRRLSTELHDYMAQLLVVARMKLMELDRLIRSPRGVRLLAETNAVLKEALRYTRTLIAELSPSILYDSGLPAAINWLASQMQRHRLMVSVDNSVSPLTIADDAAIIMFEAMRELLLNVAQHAGTDQAWITVKREDQKLAITVSDKGAGFDLKCLKANPSESDQYGLFSVRERLEAIGGSLEIDSKPGKGTRACVRAPMQEPAIVEELICEQMPGESSPRRNRGPRRRGPLRIVLVDDHELVREGLRKVIESHNGLTVVGEAANGEQAVELAGKLQPDVVVMDVNMPRMNGIEATRRITGRHPEIRIVGLSVHDDAEVASAMRQAGAVAFLCKSEASQQLCEAIRSAEMIGV